MRDGFAKQRARKLRSTPTDAERRLWYFLRRNNFHCHFKRQYPIGPYFVDLACVRLKLIIEIDGGQHASEHSYDAVRDQFLRDEGFEVLRFWNNEVLHQTEAVLGVIWRAIKRKEEPPPP